MSEALIALAKAQFQYLVTAPDCTIPKTYLKVLQNHLDKYPWDDHFTLKRQPKKDFGLLTCLEEGCQVVIPLTPLEKDIARDGGKRIGLGSLSAYQDHIETHATHKKACLRRKAQEAKASNPGGTAAPATEMNDTRGINAVASRALRVVDGDTNRRASARYTTDLAPPPTMGRKRHSESSFGQALDDTFMDYEEPESGPSSKKARLDTMQSPKSPLATNRNTLNHTPALIAPAPAGSTPEVDIDDLKEQLRELLAKISKEEVIYDRAQRKKNKSKSETTRCSTLKLHLQRLYKQRDEWKEQIRSANAVVVATRQAPMAESSMAVVKAEPQTTRLPPPTVAQRPSSPWKRPRPTFGTTSMVASTSAGATRQAPKAEIAPKREPDFPMAVDPRSLQLREANPANQAAYERETQLRAAESKQRALLAIQLERNRLAADVVARQQLQVVGSGAAPRQFLVKPEQTPMALVKRENVVASGSGSGSAVRRAIAGVKAESSDIKPLVKAEQRVNAVASSSKTPSTGAHRSSFPLPMPSSDEDDSDDMHEYPRDLFGDHGDDAAAKIAKELLEKVGMDVPAPMRDGRDDDGLFYGRGRDIYAGPQARAGDINQFLIMAGNAEQFDSSASVAKGLEKLGLKALVDLIPGMEVSLMPHQVIGVSWMIDKEAGPTKGGCLADDMGLGKTVQLIALMVMNKAPETVRHKLNLIIAPLALLDQWKYEIETKTSCGLKVLIYHGQNRPRKKSALREYDVILTTYNTMAMEWPDYEKQEKLKAKARKQKRRDDSFIVEDSDGELYEDKVRGRKEKSGLLFQMEFFRIILDEGQNVRNRTTRGSRAVSELTATYRWCLTGTPIMNSLTDTYGYIRFLKIRPWYDWSEFNAHIALKEKKNPSLAVTRLQAILATFQLRRTKQSMLDGKRLIEIPEKTIEITALEFTAEELEIYKMVEARTQATFNRYLRAGTVLKNYHQVLVLLLRLRQVCSHPCLILEEVGAFVPFEEVDHSKPELASELTRAAKLINPEFVVDMKARMKERMIARMEAEKRSADAALEGEECPICFDVMTKTAVVTACKHAFCKECIMDVINNPAVDDEVVRRKDERPCPVCRASISESHLFTRSAFEPTEKELNPNARESEDEGEAINSDDSMDVDDDDEEPVSRKGKGRAVKRGRGAYRGMEEDDDEDDDDDMSDFIVEDDEDEEDKDARRALKQRRNKGKGKRRANVIIDSDEEVEDAPEIEGVLLGRKSKAQLEKEALEKMPRFLPSTKMKFMMELIKKIFKANPEEKILIVSQWTACLSLVSDYLTEKGIGHVKYQGDMNRDKRDIAVRVFMSKEKAKIMLMSLKCGGVGLNLTRANNVISLDLAWSRAVESQAWDRLHRLGQTRTVNVQRLVIAGTVEDRIMALQDRKQSLADGSLGEGKGKKLGKLTVAQLANLFNLDARGRVLTY